MPRIAEEAGKNWEKFFAGMGEMYKPAWQKQIGFTEREKMDIALNVKTKTAFGGILVNRTESSLNRTYGATTKVQNKLGNSFVGKQVSSMSVMDIAKAANSVGGTALKTACPMAFWVGPAIESSLMIFDTLGSKGYYGDNMSTGQLVTGLLASQLTPAIGMIPGANGAGNVLSAVGKAQGGMLINYQLENLGQAIDFREENGKGSLQKGMRISGAERRLEAADYIQNKTGLNVMSDERQEKLENRANNGGKKYIGTKFDTKSFVIQSGTAAASAGISSSYAGADGMFASDLGSALFSSVAGYGMNLGLNTANKYVDAAWDVTEKNKGIKKGAYSASVKDVNKDLKKQKLADLAGVNVLDLLVSLGSAAASDGIEGKARNSLAEDGYSGADSRRLAKEQRSLESKGEKPEDAKKAVVKKEEGIRSWENQGYSRKDAEKMYAVSGQDFDTMQVAHNEEKRKQEEDAARLANAGVGMTPEEAAKGSGKITQDKDGHFVDDDGNRMWLLASVDNVDLQNIDASSGAVLDASGMNEKDTIAYLARKQQEQSKGQQTEQEKVGNETKEDNSQKKETVEERNNKILDSIRAKNGKNPSKSEVIDHIDALVDQAYKDGKIGFWDKRKIKDSFAAVLWHESGGKKTFMQFNEKEYMKKENAHLDGTTNLQKNMDEKTGEVKTVDVGMGQMNTATIEALKLDLEKMASDWKYNVEGCFGYYTKKWNAAKAAGEYRSVVDILTRQNKDKNLVYATYSGYNSGSNYSRYRTTTHLNDNNFVKTYNKEQWSY